MNDILDSLNPRQREAAYCDEGALVLAGAGTGKTRALTGRIIRLLEERAARAADILAVTFTNKATREMRSRLSAAVAVDGLWLGTFHGICHRILRMNAAAANLERDFQILDSQDQLTFLRRLMRDENIDEKEVPATEVRQHIVAAKERGLRANAVTPNNTRAEGLVEIYFLYEKACRRENKVDFSELVLAVIELLRANEELRVRYAQRFRHILIDEFQDTSRQQFDWLKLLDSGDNCFFAVGDDDQSIYAFRGAEPGIMRQFQGELRANRLIRLEENYRSGKNILAVANHLIAYNSNRLGKTLTTSATSGAPIALCPAENDLAEAKEVAAAAREHLDGGGAADDLAVLYRTNAQGRLFERALMEGGIPYRVYGGLRFYDRMEIKQALAYLRIAAGDDADALRRAINMPPRGLGAKSVESLFADGRAFDALRSSSSAKFAPFAALLKNLRVTAESAPLGKLTRAVIEQSGLLTHYEEKKEQERADNLRELVNAATQFNHENAAGDKRDNLLEFLSVAALSSGGDEDGDSQPALSLMTVHAAKGLEFNRVFVVGLEEGLFPHAQSLSSANLADIEEERRLLYVAITRARRTLSLHFAKQRMLYGKITLNPSSRFLDELPNEYLLIPRQRTAFPADSPRPFTQKTTAENAKTAPKKNGTLRPGDRVRHPKYGVGIVVRRSGGGNEAQADITFKHFGIKTFKVALAPLTKL